MILILITIFMLNAGLVYAQPFEQWHNLYRGALRDVSREVIQTPDGGYALAGTADFGEPPREDFYLVRTDENGDTLWTKYYGGNDPDKCYDLIQVENGDFMLVGTTDSYGQDGSGLIIRTDDEGDVVWERAYYDTEIFDTIIPITDDRYALIGVTHHGWDAHFVIINEDGEEQFSERYGGNGAEFGRGLVQTVDNGFLLSINSTSYGNGSYDCYLVRLNSDFEIEWTGIYGGEENDGSHCMIKTLDGGYALAGYSHSFTEEGDEDYYIVKIDENGEEQWSGTYGYIRDDICWKIIQLENGDFILAGEWDSEDESDQVGLIRLNSEGELIWDEYYWRRCKTYSMIQTLDGGYALAGQQSDRDFFLLKLSTDMIVWLPLPDSSFVEDSSLIYDIEYFYDYFIPSAYQDSMLVFSVADGEHIQGEFEDEQLIITAEEDWFGLDSLMLTIAEADSEENCDSTWLRLTVHEDNYVIDPSASDLPYMFTLFNAYPNPFNSSTTIKYNLPFSTNVSLGVYDPSGRKINTMIEGYRQAGIHNATFTAAGLSSGLYFVRLEAGGFCSIKKLILMR